MAVARSDRHSARAILIVLAIALAAAAPLAAVPSATAPASTAAPAGASPPAPPCTAQIARAPPALHQRLATHGTDAAQTTVALGPAHDWLIEAREQGNDAILEVLDNAAHLLARADHPERRTGTRRIILTPVDSQPLTLRVTGKEHATLQGTVDLQVVDLAAADLDPSCGEAIRALAAGDASYAVGQQISLGRATAGPAQARDAYLRAAQAYRAAETSLVSPADAVLRGEAALALASVRYFDLQDWPASAASAAAAGALLAERDPYRRARAQAIAAGAWLEMATNFKARMPSGDSEARRLLGQARHTLSELYAFHRRRAERYDAALQINNIGMSYSYAGRFRDCIAASRAAAVMFAALREAPREGLAAQNQAVCEWGLGHLRDALGSFNRALTYLTPDPYPQLYALTLNNTALINYALGHFDQTLRLDAQALALETRIQNPRTQAQSLYGIGITYYALGNRELAREFLERALAIRTAAFDGRGRRATLRSLATVYADLGDYSKAITYDREALDLAPSPISKARSRIPLARHTALEGLPGEALTILTQLLASDAGLDPVIRAQARLERAAIERRTGAYTAALSDLATAIPVLRRSGSLTDGFSADLEQAQVLQLTGRSAEALRAVDAALARSEAIRLQTVNPEFRAQLQLPLRAAHDLKLDLLWQRFERAIEAGRARAAERVAADAFRSADAARARSFADLAAAQYSPALRRALAADFARRETLYRDLAGLRFVLESRLDRSSSADPRSRELAAEIASLQHQVDVLNNEIAARTAAHVTPDAASISSTSDGSVPADTAIIAYWLGSQSAYAWAVTAAGIHWTRLDPPETLTAAARAFHDSLRRLSDVPRERRLQTAAALYTRIIRPLAPWIEPYRRWFVVPDAALDYVPFAALRSEAADESAYLIMAHDLAFAPAGWLLLTPRPARSPPPARLLLVSDPVYERSDPRLRAESPANAATPTDAAAPSEDLHDTVFPADRDYRRIPGSAREAAAIQTQFRAADVDALTGFRASRERLMQLDWSRYRYIHIASHGYLDAQMPQLSALILSNYGPRGERIEDALRAADLSALTLAADVVVYSGCDTALGKDVLNEGLVGLTYATLARGARSVISSLWSVADEMDAHLMTELYRHLIRDSMSPMAALSASMRSVLDRNGAADPALWAAFQVTVVTASQSTRDVP